MRGPRREMDLGTSQQPTGLKFGLTTCVTKVCDAGAGVRLLWISMQQADALNMAVAIGPKSGMP